MSNDADLKELLKIAKSIEDDKYNIDEIDLSPNSELFEIATYFKDAITKIAETTKALDKPIEELPIFDKLLNDIKSGNKKITKNIFELVDKVNFNIDGIKNNLSMVKKIMDAKNKPALLTILERNRDLAMSGQNFCYDIISSLGFHDVVKNNVNKLLKIITDIDEKLVVVLAKWGLHENVIDFDDFDKLS